MHHRDPEHLELIRVLRQCFKRIGLDPKVHLLLKRTQEVGDHSLDLRVCPFDTDKRIVAIDLVLVRSFVDHKTNGLFARDIARSLFRSAIPEEDEGAIADLVNEIESPPAGSGQSVVTARPPPKLPAKQTPGYLVYLGKRSLFEQTLTRCRLRLESRRVNGVDSLILSVIAK